MKNLELRRLVKISVHWNKDSLALFRDLIEPGERFYLVMKAPPCLLLVPGTGKWFYPVMKAPPLFLLVPGEWFCLVMTAPPAFSLYLGSGFIP